MKNTSKNFLYAVQNFKVKFYLKKMIKEKIIVGKLY